MSENRPGIRAEALCSLVVRRGVQENDEREKTMNSSTYRFGSFRLLPDRVQIFDGETRLRIGSRAIGILTLLIKRRGELISSREIMKQVWPDALVVEGTVRVHIAALRKAYKLVYRQGLTVEQALNELAESAAQFPEVAIFRDSVQASTRGITR